MKRSIDYVKLTNQEILDTVNKKRDDEYLSVYEIAYLTRISPNTINRAIYDKCGRSLAFYAKTVDGSQKVQKKYAIKWASNSKAKRITLEEIEATIARHRQEARCRQGIIKSSKYVDSEHLMTRFDIVSLVSDIINTYIGDNDDISDVDMTIMVEIITLYLSKHVDIDVVEVILSRILNNCDSIDNYDEIISVRKGQRYNKLIKLINTEFTNRQ